MLASVGIGNSQVKKNNEYMEMVDALIANEVLRLEIVYSNLYRAYMRNDRGAMEEAYEIAYNVGVPYFKKNVHNATKTLFLESGAECIVEMPIRQLTPFQLELNVVGCLNALQQELAQRNLYRTNYTYAQSVLWQPNHRFKQEDVLYQTIDGYQLKVADFLSVSKYAISIAEAIEPSNEEYARASAAITTLQGIDAVLNNKPEDKPVNKMLHLVTSFLSSVVKAALKTDEAKRNVTVTTILLDLAIDFLCKN